MNKKLFVAAVSSVLTLISLAVFTTLSWDYFINDKSDNNKAISDKTINFHQLATGKNFGSILKLFNPVIDEQNRRLYVVGSKTTFVGVLDIDKDELIDVFDIGVLGGFLIFNDNKLYSLDISTGKCYLIDPILKKTAETEKTTCANLTPKKDRGKSKEWNGYSFKETGYQSFPDGTTGFTVNWAQNLNGAYGIIEISNSSGKKVGEIVHGPDALYFAVDSTTGKLYTTNTGDGSISIFDLNKLKSTNYCEKNSCLMKEIDIGNSADQVIVDSSGNMYVRNRLGGSVIYKYNAESKKFITINNENHESGGIGIWPTDMALSKDEQRLYVLSHYGALFDVINTASNKVVSKIKFNTTLKPRTDSISAMSLDKTRDRLYAVWPEIGIIGAADGKNSEVLGTIDLTKYGFDKSKAANRGPGLVNLAADDKNNKLFVFLYNEQKLLVFNGGTLQKEKETSIKTGNKGEKQLVINPDKNEFYLGNKIFNLDTLKESGSFSKGQRVDSFNKNTVYLKEGAPYKGRVNLKIYEFVNGSQTKEWAVDNLGEIINTFFDFSNNIFYIADFLSGSVIKQNLAN